MHQTLYSKELAKDVRDSISSNPKYPSSRHLVMAPVQWIWYNRKAQTEKLLSMVKRSPLVPKISFSGMTQCLRLTCYTARVYTVPFRYKTKKPLISHNLMFLSFSKVNGKPGSLCHSGSFSSYSSSRS